MEQYKRKFEEFKDNRLHDSQFLLSYIKDDNIRFVNGKSDHELLQFANKSLDEDEFKTVIIYKIFHVNK
jgi:hypothetical protein